MTVIKLGKYNLAIPDNKDVTGKFLDDLEYDMDEVQKVLPGCKIGYDFILDVITVTAKNGEEFRFSQDKAYLLTQLMGALKRLEII